MTPWQRERVRVEIRNSLLNPVAWIELERDEQRLGAVIHQRDLDGDITPTPEYVEACRELAARGRETFATERANTLVGVIEEVLHEAEREHVVVTGIPRAGKTTFANAMGGEGAADVLHTDDLIGVQLDAGPLDWSGVSAYVAERWLAGGPLVESLGRLELRALFVEGVAAVRALRKWLAAHPEGKPCDRVLWFGTPVVALTPGQASLAKGCRTVWAEVEPLLRARGVAIEVRS